MQKPLPQSLRDMLAKHPDKFDEGWTEKDHFGGNDRPWSHWVYLKRGWCYPEPGAHIIHELTVTEIKQAFRQVQPCKCEDCRK